MTNGHAREGNSGPADFLSHGLKAGFLLTGGAEFYEFALHAYSGSTGRVPLAVLPGDARHGWQQHFSLLRVDTFTLSYGENESAITR